MVLAKTESRHFTFQALGQTKKEARALLKLALDAHGRQYIDADRAHLRELLREAWYVKLDVGSTFRDWQPLAIEGGK